MKIGLTKFNYPEIRCVTTSQENDYINLKKYNIYYYFNNIPVIKNYFHRFLFKPISVKNVDVIHSFNDICLTNNKWVVTFETMLPRFLDILSNHKNLNPEYIYNDEINKYLEVVARDNCLGVIALSKSPKKIQSDILKAYPKVRDKIEKKMFVLYPPQKIYTTQHEIEEKVLKPLKLIFVGNDFYLKGGAECILAINELLEEGIISENEIMLTVVGILNRTHNYSFGIYQDDSDFSKNINTIIMNRKNIKIYSNVDNNKVIEMIREHHIGLLPTWADTFGYSVLEFQACGCPVISTDVRALSEINNNDIGWLINVDKNKYGEIVVDSYSKKDLCRRTIIDQLKKHILSAYENPNVVINKGVESLNRIKKEHSIDYYNDKIKSVYTIGI
ncbi:glycosyltransferase [Acinetobacter baumannii]|nr:glycosyltransferase [Acinetobacter baumannii]